MLIAGDLDFAPLVDALVRLGTYVKVICELRSAAKNLCSAADSTQYTNVHTLYNWSTPRFRKQYQLPAGEWTIIGAPGDGSGCVKTGKVNGKVAQLVRSGQQFVLKVYDYSKDNPGQSLVLRGGEIEVQKYFEAIYEHIEWD